MSSDALSRIEIQRGEFFEAEFLNVRGVRELSDGEVVVADGDERVLKWFSSTVGAPIVIGRGGEGPGEYKAVTTLLRLSADTTALFDNRLNRVVFFQAAQPTDRIEGVVGSVLGADTLGHWLVGARFSPPALDRGTRIDSVLVWKAHRDSERRDTIARLKGGSTKWGRRNGVIQKSVNVLDPADRPYLFPDGWIAIASAQPYRVDWITPEGDRVAGDPIPIQRIPVDSDLKTAVLRRHGLSDGAQDFLDWPETLPAFPLLPGPWARDVLTPQGILTGTPDGRLLVRRTSVEEADSVRYDLIDRTGTVAGFLRLGANEMIAGFGKDVVYISSVQPSGVQLLRKAPWPR